MRMKDEFFGRDVSARAFSLVRRVCRSITAAAAGETASLSLRCVTLVVRRMVETAVSSGRPHAKQWRSHEARAFISRRLRRCGRT